MQEEYIFGKYICIFRTQRQYGTEVFKGGDIQNMARSVRLSMKILSIPSEENILSAAILAVLGPFPPGSFHPCVPPRFFHPRNIPPLG